MSNKLNMIDFCICTYKTEWLWCYGWGVEEIKEMMGDELNNQKGSEVEDI